MGSPNGIISGTRKWLSNKKAKIRKQALTREVKKQHRILMEQTQNNQIEMLKSDSTDDTKSYSINSDECDGIRIGNPCETFSGQGMAVLLEIHTNCENEERLIIDEEKNGDPFILNMEQMIAIAKKGLPQSILYTKWTRLYCLSRDGDCFESSFLPKVQAQERTLLIIETTNHEVMAAYSNSHWENHHNTSRPMFYGSAQACLFSLDKVTGEVRAFKWSGLNRYIQICDARTKMLAFGGGGDEGEFGLCVESDFSIGSTGPCETFRNEPLCTEDRFEVLNVECWGFMPVFG